MRISDWSSDVCSSDLDLQAWLVLGGLAQRLGDAALTEHIVDGVIERFPDEPRVALLRASQLREADKPDQAREVLATDRKSTRRTPVTNAHLVCRLLLEKKNLYNTRLTDSITVNII